MTDPRTDRYREDKDYREHVREMNRNRYREKGKTRLPKDSGALLVVLEEVGTLRTLRGKREPEPTFSTEELSLVLGYHRNTVSRMQVEKRFPRPVLKAEGFRGKVYSLAQVTAIAELISEHQEKCEFIRYTDRELIRALREVMK